MSKRKDSLSAIERSLDFLGVHNEPPTLNTSTASCGSDTDLLSANHGSTVDLFDCDGIQERSSFATIASNNSPRSFLRSPTPNNLNVSGASRSNVRRWSQSLSNAAKEKQQQTIHFMPSRMKKCMKTPNEISNESNDYWLRILQCQQCSPWIASSLTTTLIWTILW